MKPSLPQQQEAIFALLARCGEALASPRRLRIISLLSQGEKTVDQLAGLIGQTRAATSAHLKVLRTSGLVLARKEGRHVHCLLASDEVATLWLHLRALGESILPSLREIVREDFAEPDAPPMEEVIDQTATGDALLLDLRPADEFLQGHLPHAHHFPLSELPEQLSALPRRRRIFTYCRGPYCLGAIEGTRFLLEAGCDAHRLPYGVPEWRAKGLPIETARALPFKTGTAKP